MRRPHKASRRDFLKRLAPGVILVGGAILASADRAQAQAKGAAGAAGAKGAAGAAGGAKGAAGGAKGAAGAAGAAGGGGSSGRTFEIQDIPFGPEEVLVAALLGYGVYRLRREGGKRPMAAGAAAAAAG